MRPETTANDVRDSRLVNAMQTCDYGLLGVLCHCADVADLIRTKLRCAVALAKIPCAVRKLVSFVFC
jgi:hypothetical protein